MSTTAIAIARTSFQLLNVFLPGESVPLADANAALTFLNLMIGGWAQQRGTIPVVAREVFAMIADKGGPSNPYTIGVGGNLNTARPPVQRSVEGVGLLLNPGTDSETEVPYTMLTNDAWEAIQVKNLANSQFTAALYKPTYANGLGSLFLWPVPNVTTNSLVLYIQKQIAQFADLQTTSYDFPEGYDEALIYNLARRLQVPYGKTLDADAMVIARESLAAIKRNNLPLADMPTDMGWLGNGNLRSGYNIQTGNG